MSWEFLWKFFFMVILAWIAFLARDVVVALLLGIVASMAFDPVVSFLEKKKIPRILGTLLIYLVAIVAIGFIIYTFIPIALSEFTHLANQLSEILGSATGAFEFENLVEGFVKGVEEIQNTVLGNSISLIGLTSKVLGGVFFAITIFVLSFYLTVGRDGVEKFLIAILPAAYEGKAIAIYSRIERKIGRWLAGQLFLSLVVGLATWLGLSLLGVKYSLFLGVLAGIAELVPYVGPIFTGSVAILISFTVSIPLALSVLILFIIIQQIENHLLLPMVMRYTTTLNPVVTLVALLIGAKVFGVVGLILAVPVAVLVQELLEEWVATKQTQRELKTENS